MPPAEKLQLLFSWGLVVRVRLGLWILRRRRTEAWLARLQARGIAPRLPPERLARSVELASHFFPGARNCLVRGLSLRTMLRRCGHDAVLRYGVRRSAAGGFAAHAWVTLGERILIGGEESETFTELQDGPTQGGPTQGGPTQTPSA